MALSSRPLRVLVVVLCFFAVSMLAARAGFAGCPPGESNPISSGTGDVGVPVLFPSLGPALHASFFILGDGDNTNSGSLPPVWMVPVADVDGDGIPEFRIDAPGEGPGGWGDPLTNGCPSAMMPPRPPLVLVLHHRPEDLDGDGKFDRHEDRNRNGILDAHDLDGDGVAQCGQPSGNGWNFESEDLDCDGDLTPAPSYGQIIDSCEGFNREDKDCDGNLDRIDEDPNRNRRCDPGEPCDVDNDGRIDRGNEDRNANGRLDDRPFPDPADPRNPLCQDPSNRFPVDPSIPCSIPHVLPAGVTTALYPYGALRPAPGGIVVASVEWNGTAYDFDAINTPTRLVTLDDGRIFRLVEPTPLERLMGRTSGLRVTGCTDRTVERMYLEVDGLDLADDRHGTRAIFDAFQADIGGQQMIEFPTQGNGAGGTFINLFDYWLPNPGYLIGRPLSAGSNAFLSLSTVLGGFYTPDLRDFDLDDQRTPYDICPVTPDPICHDPYPHYCDSDDDGIGDACDPSLDPAATVDSVWVEHPLGDPGIRDGAAMVYDEGRGVVVLFGGSADRDTWEFDGAAWRQVVTADAPPARKRHRMAYDSGRGRVLLFGGIDTSFDDLGDFWQYDGVNWSELTIAESPSPRSEFGFAYDSRRDRVVLFGGCVRLGDFLGDTWEFDGALWRRAPTAFSPTPNCSVQMAYDSFRGLMVMRGDLDVIPPPNIVPGQRRPGSLTARAGRSSTTGGTSRSATAAR
jgi:hypothetical protein